MIKQKPIYVCDNCGKEIDNRDFVITSGFSNEGDSEIMFNHNTFYVGDAHYCDLNCLFDHIKKELEVK